MTAIADARTHVVLVQIACELNWKGTLCPGHLLAKVDLEKRTRSSPMWCELGACDECRVRPGDVLANRYGGWGGRQMARDEEDCAREVAYEKASNIRGVFTASCVACHIEVEVLNGATVTTGHGACGHDIPTD